MTNASATASLGLVAGLGPGGDVRHALEQRVGVGLEPQRTRRSGSARAAGTTAVARSCGRRAPSRSAFRQRLVAIVYSQARSEERPSKLLKPAPGRQQRLLKRVLGVLERAEDPVAVDLQLAPVGLGELAERLLVAGAGAGQSARGHGRIVSRGITVCGHRRGPKFIGQFAHAARVSTNETGTDREEDETCAEGQSGC